jgi:DNA polymerase I-like protein with 3'-5' exonuclease and polymerase domains
MLGSEEIGDVYITALDKEFSYIPRNIIGAHISQIQKEIQVLKPNVCLIVGENALQYLVGERGIKNWRGSVLWSNTLQTKCVITQNPDIRAGDISDFSDQVAIQWDIRRAGLHARTPNYEPKKRNLVVGRNSCDLLSFLRTYKRPYCSLDIETFHTFPLCIGMAFDSTSAISVPLFSIPELMKGFDISQNEIFEIWKLVADVLYDESIKKIGQNFKFDQKLLHTCQDGKAWVGLATRNFYFDTNLAMSTLYPELSSSLAFIASTLLEEPYYKEEGKGYNPKKDKFDRLLLYNARDAVVQFEAYERQIEELRAHNTVKFFFNHMMEYQRFYTRLESRGILLDADRQQALDLKYKEAQKNKERELFELTKEYIDKPINVNSPKDVPILLFEAMKLPKRASTDEDTLDALMRNVVKDKNQIRILELILEIRKIRKALGTYINCVPDHRGRICTNYRVSLETGRTSTNILKPPVTIEKYGLALQTISKHTVIGKDLRVGEDIRSLFIPDEGYIFVESDLSQAEARVVALLANDDRLLKMFKYKIDIHRVTSAWIIDACPNELLTQFFTAQDTDCISLRNEINSILKNRIDDEFRQVGKKGRHAANYDMGKGEAATQLAISEAKANVFLNKIHDTNPNIRGVFHKSVQEALAENNRTWYKPNGRRRQFMGKWGDKLFKEAYADIPQGTVSDHLKDAAITVEKRTNFIPLAESHDSFFGLCPLAIGEQYPFKHLDALIPIIREEMEKEIDFRNCTISRGKLIIPCDISIGEKNWKEMKKV